MGYTVASHSVTISLDRRVFLHDQFLPPCHINGHKSPFSYKAYNQILHHFTSIGTLPKRTRIEHRGHTHSGYELNIKEHPRREGDSKCQRKISFTSFNQGVPSEPSSGSSSLPPFNIGIRSRATKPFVQASITGLASFQAATPTPHRGGHTHVHSTLPVHSYTRHTSWRGGYGFNEATKQDSSKALHYGIESRGDIRSDSEIFPSKGCVSKHTWPLSSELSPTHCILTPPIL